MNFSYLPTELKDAIVSDLDFGTLAALCLVSRSTLKIARPHLYSDLYLNLQYKEELQLLQISSHDGPEIDSSEGKKTKEERIELLLARQILQGALISTLEARPEWCLYVGSLRLTIDTTAGEGWTLVSKVLPSFANLKEFTVFNVKIGVPDDDTCGRIVASCPRSVTSVDLLDASLPTTSVIKLLEKLPRLKSLSLSGSHSPEDGTSPPAALRTPLDNLLYLTLRRPVLSSSSFAAIANAAPRLTTLEVDFDSVSVLIPSLLSGIRRLVIADGWNRPGSNPVHRTEQLVSVLKSCTSLESCMLAVCSVNEASKTYRQFEEQRVLHHLPSSLRDLSFHFLYLSPSYYLDFLSNHDTTSLQKLTLSRMIDQQASPPVYDRVTQAKV